MTTDFRVTYRDKNGKEKYKAYSVKDSHDQVFGDLSNPEVKRLVEKQSVEMSYWKLQGIPFRIIFGDRDINRTLATNIAIVVEYYDLSKVHTPQEFLCYLIAHKYIQVEMDKMPLDIQCLTKECLGTPEQMSLWIAEVVKTNGESKYLERLNCYMGLPNNDNE